ncbi:hypothetical protein [Spiroplasma culicicola]|uniref:Uncharacterized protein n=1 Tax=Spiroplasma culicicola AES-1 TaxID=1276246 RepID=W6A8V8_9MOLU|nr:hypothetical protein [Spiroplasma culicicola]AHI53325.1 hypothetical protein SCULI_v1c09850 [Spiroplasma culicicola AES-1]
MKKLLSILLLVMIPNTCAAAIMAINFIFTKIDIGNYINYESLTNRQNIELSTLNDYDDGLNENIKTSTENMLLSNYGLEFLEEVNILYYYGNVDETNFWKKEEITFEGDFTYNLVLNYTVAIIANNNSKFKGQTYINFDFRPTIHIDQNLNIFDKKSMPTSNFFKSFNKWIINSTIVKNLNNQLINLGLNVHQGLGAGSDNPKDGLIMFSDKQISNLEASFGKNNSENVFKKEYLNIFSDKALSSLFKLENDIYFTEDNYLELKSSTFKNDGLDYTIIELSEHDYQNFTLNDIYVPSTTLFTNYLNNKYNDELTIENMIIDFRNASYKNPIISKEEYEKTKLISLINSNDEIELWVEIFFINKIIYQVDSEPGIHIVFEKGE